MASIAARKSLEAHIRGERERDLAAAMAPLSDHPRYVVPNFIFDGPAAIEAMYRLVLPSLTPENADEYLRALDDPVVARWGDDHCVLEYSDDYPLHKGMVVVIHFDGDKVKSENTYFTSVQRFVGTFPPDAFVGVPGVTCIDPQTDH